MQKQINLTSEAGLEELMNKYSKRDEPQIRNRPHKMTQRSKR